MVNIEGLGNQYAKDTTIKIRVTKEQKKAIKSLAHKREMTMSEYMLYCIMRETKESIINADTKIMIDR